MHLYLFTAYALESIHGFFLFQVNDIRDKLLYFSGQVCFHLKAHLFENNLHSIVDLKANIGHTIKDNDVFQHGEEQPQT